LSNTIYLICSSINELKYLNSNILKQIYKVIIIDEGDEKIRNLNYKRLSGLNVDFYGPKERLEWFKGFFGERYEKYSCVIPQKCHAETSFGFLVSYDEGADVVIEIDDDVKILNDNFVDEHIDNLFNKEGFYVSSVGKWYNTIENLDIGENLFPRGHPYERSTRNIDYSWEYNGDQCVLNMGLWLGNPDLDALTIICQGGLDGRSNVCSNNIKYKKVIVKNGTYFAICSMNTSFRRKIIPAFYQLYMNHLNIDRYDDIWSGIFIKKIADHLNDNVCLGYPLVYHDKRPRNVFNDLRAEIEGMIITETLWKLIDDAVINNNNYFDCYDELINVIEKNINVFNDSIHRDYMLFQLDKMKLWLKIIDEIA